MNERDKTKEQLINELAKLNKKIEELEESEAEHKKIEEKLRSFMDFAPDAFVLYDSELNFVDANKVALQMMKMSKEKLIGKNILEIAPALKDRDRYKKYKEVLKTGTPFVFDDLIPDPKYGDLCVSVQAFKAESGLGLIFINITERRDIEDKLRKSEERFRASVESMLDCFGIYSAIRDKSGRIVDFRVMYVNEAACVSNRMTKEEQIGKCLCEILPAHKETGLFDEYCELVEKGKPLSKESLYYEDTYKGKVLNRAFDIRTVKLGDGFASAWRDITETKWMEEVLLESEKKYRSVVENANDAIYIITPDGFGYVNPAFEKLTGYTSEELYSKDFNIWNIIHPDDIKLIKKKEEARRKGEEISSRYEFRIIAKEGEIKIVEPATVEIGEKGEAKVLGILRDITERKQAEKELLLHSEIMINMSEGVYLIRANDGIIVYANPKFEEIFGYGPGEMIGKHVSIVNAPTEKPPEEAAKDIIEIINREAQWKGEIKNIRKDGTHFWCYASVSIFDHPDYGRVWVVVHTDITERKKAEEERGKLQAQLIQSEKMAGIGTLSSGIAHEFNNLLQIMSGHVQFAEKTKKPEEIKEAFDIVLSTTDRASKIIQDLLTFSRTEETKRELCSIKEPLESVLSLTEDQLKKNNIVVVREYGRASQLKVNKGEMQQVFLNMVTNARDTLLPRGGRLEIGIRQEKGQVKVSFHDTGKGIRKEDLGRVFEPFYTTKGAVGGSEIIAGTGLGLSVSYGIVKRHGGTIEVESKRGRGTTFTVRLPVKRVRTRKRTVMKKTN